MQMLIITFIVICVFHSLTSSYSFHVNNIYRQSGSRFQRRALSQQNQPKVVQIPLRMSNVIEVSDSNERQRDVLTALQNIVDPDAGDDIVSSGQVQRVTISQDGVVSFSLYVQDINSPINNELKRLCENELSSVKWIRSVSVDIADMKSRPKVSPFAPSSAATATSSSPQKSTQTAATTSSAPPAAGTPNAPTQTAPAGPSGMSGVKNVIAVSSCKGGVGKSTVSVNLAYTLAKAGAKVGILDADIYGPSLPTMTKPVSTDIVFANNQLKPLEYNGVKLMSMGFINKGASIMRGPMVNQILNQFVALCNWGDLDYLVIDMPPGTGDIQLTLAQIMNISAAVIVTTPQRLSFVDVVKGIDLFDTVNVPCVAVVENMAEYSTYSFPPGFFESLGAKAAGVASASSAFSSDPSAAITAVTKSIKDAVEAQKKPRRVFGEGHNSRLKEMWGIENIISIPLVEEVSASGDSGLPYVLKYPESEVAAGMTELAAGVANELVRLSKVASSGPKLVFEKATNEVVFEGTKRLPARKLRMDCRCAVCVEEFTGKALLDPAKVPDDVKVLMMAPIGRYAMSVDWSDGHKSLYPFKQVAKLMDASEPVSAN